MMQRLWRHLALLLPLVALVGLPLEARSPKPLKISSKTPKPARYPGLLVVSGESWIFKVDRGQPMQARKVTADTMPAEGELKVSIDGQSGTTMTIINNAPVWYDYRAYLSDISGKRGTPTSVCTLMGGGRSAFENWPQGIAAIRIADFKAAQGEQVICR